MLRRLVSGAVVVLIASVVATAPRGASAQQAVVLTEGPALARLDLTTRTAAAPVPVTGVDGRLVGIDVRPADGRLYALSERLTLYVVDPGTGRATRLRTLDARFETGARALVDFNPAADRLRLINAEGQSLRVNVDTGEAVVDGSLRYQDGDAHAGRRPRVLAGAYTNSMAGVRGTELFDIDAANGVFALQSPPNDGVLQTRARLDPAIAARGVVDIVITPTDDNLTFVLAEGVLWRLDPDTGAADRLGPVTGLRGEVLDLAILPMR